MGINTAATGLVKKKKKGQDLEVVVSLATVSSLNIQVFSSLGCTINGNVLDLLRASLRSHY